MKIKFVGKEAPRWLTLDKHYEVKSGCVDSVMEIIDDEGDLISVIIGNKGGHCCYGTSSWVVVEEFDMKTQPWFIRVNEANFNLVKDWVESKGFTVSFCFNPDTMTYITNVGVWGDIFSYSALCGVSDIENRAKEIKLNFKTTLESVEYPEVVDKDEEERIAIRKEMEALAERLKALEGN